MISSYKITGLESLKKRMKKLNTEARKATAGSINESADKVLANAQTLVPVDTGALKKSLKVIKKASARRQWARVGAKRMTMKQVASKKAKGKTIDDGGAHAHLVEFGTSHSPAQPFLLPALQMEKNKFKTKIAAAMRAALASA